jgi:hypothetical protein
MSRRQFSSHAPSRVMPGNDAELYLNEEILVEFIEQGG